MKKYTEKELKQIYADRFESENYDEMTWDLENLVWKNDDYYLNKFSKKMVEDLGLNDEDNCDEIAIIEGMITTRIADAKKDICWV